MNSSCDCERATPMHWPTALHGLAWRRALGRLGREALTLHRYRELRARAFRDALARESACRGPASPGAGRRE